MTTTAGRTSTSRPGTARSTGPRWVEALDAIGYTGPVMLECIRHIRDNPEGLTDAFLGLLRSIAGIA